METITIAGGGLAGLTLGLLLRRQNVPVEIWDAGTYPRPRVCGEFISGRGLDILTGLNLPGVPAPLGFCARSVRFFNGARSSDTLNLPRPALSVDRAALDHLMAIEFQKRGGILREQCRWTGSFERSGLVRATGRRLKKGRSPQFFGLKMHARNLPLRADLELHFSDRGYLGLSRQKDGTVNACALLRAVPGIPDVRANCGEILSRLVAGPLRDRLAAAEVDAFASVAGISLEKETARGASECRIGDSICMIPPFTGNGMSLAMESAAQAAPLLQKFSAGQLDWEIARGKISQICDRRFFRRLTFAGLLQFLAFQSAGRAVLLSILRTTPGALNGWFRLTR